VVKLREMLESNKIAFAIFSIYIYITKRYGVKSYFNRFVEDSVLLFVKEF